ncbi:hypothetical protein LCGC14_0927050 [marine sediment metagenome]|uniref:Uncharacterized protein n=1 Tax=marine sediment metagenome TaxID=412755 RepID=A0A0F9NTV3_9ZZZZ
MLARGESMTKQEEIREGIRLILDSEWNGYNWETLKQTMSRVHRIKTETILSYLHSQGAVLKGSAISAGKHMHGVYRVESLVEEK